MSSRGPLLLEIADLRHTLTNCGKGTLFGQGEGTLSGVRVTLRYGLKQREREVGCVQMSGK